MADNGFEARLEWLEDETLFFSHPSEVCNVLRFLLITAQRQEEELAELSEIVTEMRTRLNRSGY